MAGRIMERLRKLSSHGLPTVEVSGDIVHKKPFQERHPLISKIGNVAKKAGKVAAIAGVFSVVAMAGANLGTYFDYKRNNYDYAKLGNGTMLNINGSEKIDDITKMALKAAAVQIVGNKPPTEAKLTIIISEGGRELETKYVMTWNTNNGMAKRDEEEITIFWKNSSEGFVPYKASTRYHYKTVDMHVPPKQPVIIIQNSAHTPGIPGTVLHYKNNDYRAIDAFTDFAASKWTGACLATDFPQKFSALPVVFETEIKLK